MKDPDHACAPYPRPENPERADSPPWAWNRRHHHPRHRPASPPRSVAAWRRRVARLPALPLPADRPPPPAPPPRHPFPPHSSSIPSSAAHENAPQVTPAPPRTMTGPRPSLTCLPFFPEPPTPPPKRRRPAVASSSSFIPSTFPVVLGRKRAPRESVLPSWSPSGLSTPLSTGDPVGGGE